MSNRSRYVSVLFLSVAVLTFAGCAGENQEPAAEAEMAAETADIASAEAAEIVISEANMEAVLTVLAAADGVDGVEDGVIAKCPGCSLMMEGSADHAMTVADHELHFCSDSCRDRFAENAEASLIALEIPGQ